MRTISARIGLAMVLLTAGLTAACGSYEGEGEHASALESTGQELIGTTHQPGEYQPVVHYYHTGTLVAAPLRPTRGTPNGIHPIGGSPVSDDTADGDSSDDSSDDNETIDEGETVVNIDNLKEPHRYQGLAHPTVVSGPQKPIPAPLPNGGH